MKMGFNIFLMFMFLVLYAPNISYAKDERAFLEGGIHFGGEGLPTDEMAG